MEGSNKTVKTGVTFVKSFIIVTIKCVMNTAFAILFKKEKFKDTLTVLEISTCNLKDKNFKSRVR